MTDTELLTADERALVRRLRSSPFRIAADEMLGVAERELQIRCWVNMQLHHVFYSGHHAGSPEWRAAMQRSFGLSDADVEWLGHRIRHALGPPGAHPRSRERHARDHQGLRAQWIARHELPRLRIVLPPTQWRMPPDRFDDEDPPQPPPMLLGDIVPHHPDAERCQKIDAPASRAYAEETPHWERTLKSDPDSDGVLLKRYGRVRRRLEETGILPDVDFDDLPADDERILPRQWTRSVEGRRMAAVKSAVRSIEGLSDEQVAAILEAYEAVADLPVLSMSDEEIDAAIDRALEDNRASRGVRGD